MQKEGGFILGGLRAEIEAGRAETPGAPMT